MTLADLERKFALHEARQSISFIPDVPVIARLRGANFAGFTKNMERPYDIAFSKAMVSAATYIANRFEAQRQGVIAVISSVAGDRGRQSNYVYGAAKGCLDVFLQGLAHRLSRASVRVVTLKPGFVDTPMTASFKKSGIWASPERVARDIHRAIERRRSGVVYTPAFWRWIMLVIRLLPAQLLHRTRL